MLSVAFGPQDNSFIIEGTGGWRGELREGDYDQGHHYAGMFFLGYKTGPIIARAIGHMRDPDNDADRMLGYLAINHAQLFGRSSDWRALLPRMMLDALGIIG